MRDLERRLNTLEAQQRQGHAVDHFIPILQYPWDLHAEDQDHWLAEQLACDCQPDCPGKRVGALLPEKCTPEEWTAKAQQYYRERMSR
jgi:hypothetical protein